MSHASVFLMDAYDTLMLLYATNTDLPYPPSPSSSIRRTINELRRNRKKAPFYITMREEDPTASQFYNKLVDEPIYTNPPLEGEAGVAFNGYAAFIDWIKFASEDFQVR